MRATRGSPTQDGTDATHELFNCVVSFLMARYRTAIKACCDHKSREYALSLCGVTFRDTLSVRVVRSPEHTITTNDMYVSESVGNVL